jgi:predicted membrane protein
MNKKDVFLINFENEKLSLALVIWLFSFLLYNFLSISFPLLSDIFFIISIFLVPLYLAIVLIYSLIKSKESNNYSKNKSNKKTKKKNKNKK